MSRIGWLRRSSTRQSGPVTGEAIGYAYDPAGRPIRTHAVLGDGTADCVARQRNTGMEFDGLPA